MTVTFLSIRLVFVQLDIPSTPNTNTTNNTKNNMTPDRRVEEILNNNRAETLFDSDDANEIANTAINNFIKVVLPELTQHHQDLMRELVGELEGMKMRNMTDDEYVQNIFDQVQRMPLAGTNPHYRAGAEHGYNRAISQAQNIIKSLSK